MNIEELYPKELRAEVAQAKIDLAYIRGWKERELFEIRKEIKLIKLTPRNTA